MSQKGGVASAEMVPASDAISTTSAAERNSDISENKSSNSTIAEKDAKTTALAAPIATVPHLSADDGQDVLVVDAQAGAVGATWKHRVPALLMIMFFTREYCSLLPFPYLLSKHLG